MTLDEFFEREAVETTKHRADEAKSTREWLESRGKR
jgi:ribosomal protein L17